MKVTVNAFETFFNPLKPALNQLTALFFRFIESITTCWGSRKAKNLEAPSETTEKVETIFKKVVLDKKPFAESRFPKKMWDLASGVNQDDLSFLASVEQSLSDSENLELKKQIANKNQSSFITFLRKLDNFDEKLSYIKSLLIDIRAGKKTREELMHAVREIRQYFINRSSAFSNNTGQNNGGIVEPFVKEFREPLFGPSRPMGSIYRQRDGFILHEVYENRGTKKIEGWVAGFTMQENGHAVAYVYTKDGFIKFDNLYAKNTLYSIDEVSEILYSIPDDVLTLLHFPLNTNKDRLPDAKSWVTPKWENNNCFAAASLMFLATCQHYSQ